MFGHKKQGAAIGYMKIGGKGLLVRGLNMLADTISTPLAAPVIAAVRLRSGSAGSARAACCQLRVVRVRDLLGVPWLFRCRAAQVPQPVAVGCGPG